MASGHITSPHWCDILSYNNKFVAVVLVFLSETSLKRPQMLEPTIDTMKVYPGEYTENWVRKYRIRIENPTELSVFVCVCVWAGSSINKTCRVFLPGNGVHTTIVIWVFKDDYVSQYSSERIHQGPQTWVSHWFETVVIQMSCHAVALSLASMKLGLQQNSEEEVKDVMSCYTH